MQRATWLYTSFVTLCVSQYTVRPFCFNCRKFTHFILWLSRHSKSPPSWLFAQSFVQAQMKENTKAPRHWPLWGESTGDRWIPSQRASNAEKSFHLTVTSSSIQIFFDYDNQQVYIYKISRLAREMNSLTRQHKAWWCPIVKKYLYNHRFNHFCWWNFKVFLLRPWRFAELFPWHNEENMHVRNHIHFEMAKYFISAVIRMVY